MMLLGLDIRYDKQGVLGKYIWNVISERIEDHSNAWNEWKHPKNDNATLVLCKAYFDVFLDDVHFDVRRSTVNGVKLHFGSGKAMSRCIGVGVEGAIVRYNRGSSVTHVVQERQLLDVRKDKRQFAKLISEEGYMLVEVITDSNVRSNTDAERVLCQSVEYGEHSEEKRPSGSLVEIQDVHAIPSSTESHTESERYSNEGGHSADARGNGRNRSTCTYIRRVRVILVAGGKVGDQNRHDPGCLIHPQFEFTFRLQSGGCTDRGRSITIVSATELALLNGDMEEVRHDNIEVSIGTNGSSTLDVSSCNNNWEDMIKSKKKRTPNPLSPSIDEDVVQSLTICKGFAVENLCESHLAKFRLRHVSGNWKDIDVLNRGSHVTVCPRFQTVFLPEDHEDAAAPYKFEACRELYKEEDKKPHQQTYEAEFFVNHLMNHIICSPENVEDREFVQTNRPQFSFEEEEEEEKEEEEEEDVLEKPGIDTDYRWKVLVVGDEKKDVEAFLRAATNSNSPARIFSLGSEDEIIECASSIEKHIAGVESKREAIAKRTNLMSCFVMDEFVDGIESEGNAEDWLAKRTNICLGQINRTNIRSWRPFGKKQKQPSEANLDFLVERLRALRSSQSKIVKEFGESSITSKATSELKSDDMGKGIADALQIAEWELNETSIFFHQPLNVNSLLSEVEEKVPVSIHPFNFHSRTRAQLKVDIPMYHEHKDGTKLCILVINNNNIKAPLQHFLYHYYDLQKIPGFDYEVPICSPAPLLILLRSRLSEHEKHILHNSLSSVMKYAHVQVMEWPMHISSEEESVCKYVQRNVVQGSTMIQPSGTNVHARQFQILQMISDVIRESHHSSIYMKLLDCCLKKLPDLVRGSRSVSMVLDTICSIWKIPEKLKRVLVALILETDGVHISYILSIIIFCKRYIMLQTSTSKYEEFDTIGDLENEMKLVHDALERCQSINYSREINMFLKRMPLPSKESLPKKMLGDLGLENSGQLARRMQRELQRFINRIGNAQDHPHKDSVLLVLCKASIGGSAAERRVNAVELCFGSVEAMSHCIGVGVECAVVRHDSSSPGTTLIQQLQGVEWLPSNVLTLETIAEEDYLLLEVVSDHDSKDTDHDNNDNGRAPLETDLLKMYGVAFEENAGARYSFATVIDESETAIESSHLQKAAEDEGKEDVNVYAAAETDDVALAEACQGTADEEEIETDMSTEGADSEDEAGEHSSGCRDEGEGWKLKRIPGSGARDTDGSEVKEEGSGHGSGHGGRNRNGEGGGDNGSEDETDRMGGRGSGSKDKNEGKETQGRGNVGGDGDGDGDGGGSGNGNGFGGEPNRQSQYTKLVGVNLRSGGAFRTNLDGLILLEALKIFPQFEFQFQLHRGNQQRRITIRSKTLFGTDGNEKWYHDKMEVMIGSADEMAAALDLGCFDEMIESEMTVEAQPKKPSTTAEVQVKGGIGVAQAKAGASRTWEGHSNQTATACDGFEISNLSSSHFARFQLNHVHHNPKLKKKKNKTSVKGLQTTICPKFKIVFTPFDEDPAAKYTFHASRMWAQLQEHRLLPLRMGDPHPQPIQQYYDADFHLNHNLASLLGVWDKAQNQQFVKPQLDSGRYNYITSTLDSRTL